MLSRLIETQHTVVVHCGLEEGWKVADNMIEEMKIAAIDLHHKLGLGSISLGNDQSRFKLSTGVDFTDCDILGNNFQYPNIFKSKNFCLSRAILLQTNWILK